MLESKMISTNEKFKEIYEKYKNLILKIAYDITKDYHLSQDICQKTFEKLYGYQNHVDEERVKSWLVVVASNEARDYCRKGGNYSLLFSGTAELECILECENCIDLHIDREARRELLGRMMEGLRQKNCNWYEVFLLVEYLEIPRKVIAKQRGVSLSTVDVYLRKAKKWLFAHYQNDYETL